MFVCIDTNKTKEEVNYEGGKGRFYMTLQEADAMDTEMFHSACKAAGTGTDDLASINEGVELDAAINNFDAFVSTPESILAIHKTGQSCP